MQLNRRAFLAVGGCAVAGFPAVGGAGEHASAPADVCVYGGTASGVMAAVAAARGGCRVVLVEPSRWLGGMTGGGIDAIDWGTRKAVGGTAIKVLKDTTSNPAYRRTFVELAATHGITVIYEHRLGGVDRDGATIRGLVLDHAPPDATGCPVPSPVVKAALRIDAKVFIDCSYEGDLLAQSGVSYTFGRESREEYGESFAGVRPPLAIYDIDPYIKPGDPHSGLLPLVQDIQPGPEGSADTSTMMYCWRWKLTSRPDRIPIEAPADYDPRTFELFRRGFAANIDMATGRRMRQLGEYEPAGGSFYGANSSRALIAQSIAGLNTGYPDGDWATRSRIWRLHQEFVRGVTRFLTTDPVVPEKWRAKASTIGFEPGHFDDTGGWPHQLYVREARRMRSSYVLTQHDLEGKTDPDDSVGLGSYGLDDWPYATHALGGKVAINGGEFSILRLRRDQGGTYKIPYRAIAPLARECTNLLVPVCCSASHLAMTSTRMEPVWMILGESAGVAAALAVQARVTVQDVDYPCLRTALRAIDQVLEWPGNS